MNILSQFHYSRNLPITTVGTLVEALDSLIEQNADINWSEREKNFRNQKTVGRLWETDRHKKDAARTIGHSQQLCFRLQKSDQ